MRLYYAEGPTDYSVYSFPYQVHAVAEGPHELPALYGGGFLPGSANPDAREEVFYLARSVRIDLSRFEDTSENRRVDRRMTQLAPVLEAHPKAAFDTDSAEFRDFCLRYAEERFVGGEMRPERLAYLLQRDTLTHVFTVRAGSGDLLAHVFTCLAPGLLHYWFAFFDTQYLSSHSLGKWLMWRLIRWAKDEGRDYAYLGTGYRSKALYKVRDHKGAEFFDGRCWNTDLEELKRRCVADS